MINTRSPSACNGCTYNAFIQEQASGSTTTSAMICSTTRPIARYSASRKASSPSRLAPRLGIEVNEDYVVELAQQGHRWRNPPWRHADGSIAGWEVSAHCPTVRPTKGDADEHAENLSRGRHLLGGYQ
jgi:hypothetical protein